MEGETCRRRYEPAEPAGATFHIPTPQLQPAIFATAAVQPEGSASFSAKKTYPYFHVICIHVWLPTHLAQ